MTNEELKNFILCGSIHTLSIRTMDDVKAVPKSMKKTVRCISRKTERGMQTTCFLNLHLIDGEIYSYLQFKEKLDMVLRFLGISEYKVIRVDFRFDSFESGHYQKYAKLNRYLISMLACAYSVKNKYRTSDLFSQKQLTVAIKNKYFECENYDKQKESDGKSETDGRLELRSKHWTDNDVERNFRCIGNYDGKRR